MDVFKQIDKAARRSKLEAVDLVQLLKRELGERAAATLHINDAGRWAFRFAGQEYSGSTFGEVAQVVARLKAGDRRPRPVQEGFSLPMVRGGER